MSNLRLGVIERYEISDEIIEKHNVKEGTISPFTRLKVIDINNRTEPDIREAKGDKGPDIREIKVDSGPDIREIKIDSGPDIKEIK